MDKVEEYRRLAVEAEKRAEAAPTDHDRRHYLQLAISYLALAERREASLASGKVPLTPRAPPQPFIGGDILSFPGPYRRRFVPRIRATTMLGSPGGFSGGNGSRFGAGGSSLSRIAFQRSHARRQREAVGGDRLPQQLGEGGLIVGG